MIYLFLSILLFGFNNVLWKKNLQNVNVLFLVCFRALFTATLSLLIAYNYSSFDMLTGANFFKVTLGSLFGVIGLLSMLTVLQKASLHWLGIYNLIGIVFTTCYLIFFENLELKQSMLGVFLLILGFIYHIYTNTNKSFIMTFKQHILLLLMTVSFCLSSLVHWKNLAREIPTLVIVSNQEFVVFSTTLFIILFRKQKGIIRFESCKKHFLNVVLMASVIFFALLFSFLGLKLTNPLTSSIVFLASPLTTIVMNLFFFKEKMTLHNGIALFLVASGAFILHYYTV